MGTHQDGVFGPLPTQINVLVADIVPLATHVDDDSMLPSHEQQINFNKRAQLHGKKVGKT